MNTKSFDLAIAIPLAIAAASFAIGLFNISGISLTPVASALLAVTPFAAGAFYSLRENSKSAANRPICFHMMMGLLFMAPVIYIPMLKYLEGWTIIFPLMVLMGEASLLTLYVQTVENAKKAALEAQPKTVSEESASAT